MKIRFKKYGHKGILVQWPAEASLSILDEMQSFISSVKNTFEEIDLIYHAYHEVYIEFSSFVMDFDIYVAHLQNEYKAITTQHKRKSNKWIIPVCYDTNLVPDLAIYLRNKELDLDKFIKLHTEKLYTVYFTGFLPGFLYLGGLSESLSIDRKQVPSKKIKKRTVAIGGQQTGIYPQDSPGGWFGVGYTPISFFDPTNTKNPTWAKLRDTIQFKAISSKELESIEKETNLGPYTFQADRNEG